MLFIRALMQQTDTWRALTKCQNDLCRGSLTSFTSVCKNSHSSGTHMCRRRHTQTLRHPIQFPADLPGCHAGEQGMVRVWADMANISLTHTHALHQSARSNCALTDRHFQHYTLACVLPYTYPAWHGRIWAQNHAHAMKSLIRLRCFFKTIQSCTAVARDLHNVQLHNESTGVWSISVNHKRSTHLEPITGNKSVIN